MDILENMMELNIQFYFFLTKNVRQFLIELDILLYSKAILQKFILTNT